MIHRGRTTTLVETRAVGVLSADYHEFVERDTVAAGAKILASMAINILVLSEEL